MDTATTQLLCGLNNEFYAQVSESFSATRQSPWNGWHACAQMVQERVAFCAPVPAADYDCEETEGCEGVASQPFTVTDIACGNLRFETFLASQLEGHSLQMFAIDDCETLLPDEIAGQVTFQRLDVVEALMRGEGTLAASVRAPQADVLVSYGFMHHIPGIELRERFLRELLAMAKPGGLVMASFWQFMNNETLARKAAVTHAAALWDLRFRGLDDSQLDEGDYFLGWKDEVGIYRYCHHFTPEEVEHLVLSVADKAEVVSIFDADGRTDNLNRYVILQKHN